MRAGVNLINFGPGASPASLARAAELAESLGYHLLMISDHVAVTPDVQARYPAPLYDPFTTLGWLAALTRRIELGTTVIIVPYRHPIVVAATLNVAHAILAESYISFLGFGIQPPTPSWGNMLESAQSYLTSAPWLAIIPGAAITLAVTSFNFVGDGLRDAFDPLTKRR